MFKDEIPTDVPLTKSELNIITNAMFFLLMDKDLSDYAKDCYRHIQRKCESYKVKLP
jgi:hypothetical protein